MALTPISMAPSTTSNSACSPRSWPAVRGSPRCLAQRPLPSITIATWRGTSSGGSCGGRAPDGGGVGGRTSRRVLLATFLGSPHRRHLHCASNTNVDRSRRSGSMDRSNQQIEQQMTVLLRRVQRIHLSTSTGEVNLERSAYGIMCKLADEGPQRLGALANAFGLDPSTITRQVQALEEIGLAVRKTDPTDRRASTLDLTENGREVLDETRGHRRARLQQALSDWPETDLADFGRLLKEFNASLDQLLEDS